MISKLAESKTGNTRKNAYRRTTKTSLALLESTPVHLLFVLLCLFDDERRPVWETKICPRQHLLSLSLNDFVNIFSLLSRSFSPLQFLVFLLRMSRNNDNRLSQELPTFHALFVFFSQSCVRLLICNLLFRSTFSLFSLCVSTEGESETLALRFSSVRHAYLKSNPSAAFYSRECFDSNFCVSLDSYLLVRLPANVTSFYCSSYCDMFRSALFYSFVAFVISIEQLHQIKLWTYIERHEPLTISCATTPFNEGLTISVERTETSLAVRWLIPLSTDACTTRIANTITSAMDMSCEALERRCDLHVDRTDSENRIANRYHHTYTHEQISRSSVCNDEECGKSISGYMILASIQAIVQSETN